MTDTLTNIGTVVSVSATLAANPKSATEYGALSWTEITGVASVGEIGPVYEVVTHSDLKDGVTRKAHGTLNNGDPAMQYRVVEADAGQVIINDALNAQTTIAFKVTRASGLIQYFEGIISSAPTNEATGSAVYAKSSNIGVSSALVEVAA